MFIKAVILSFFVLSVFRNNNKYSVYAQIQGKPLILTPYIKQDNIDEARSLSEVDPKQFNGTKSYSGFFTVNKQHNSNSFFWFFPSQADYLNAPLILYLEGGPGVAFMYTAFSGIGPLFLNNDGNAEMGKYSLTRYYSLLYIDNPIGTGYSFTDKGGYARNQTIIQTQIYEALMQFFQLFPEMQKNDLYIYGVSYGGKFVPSASYIIHMKNKSAKQKINLKGLIMGNGWSDPKHQALYSELLYQISLIDLNAKLEFIKYEDTLMKLIDGKEWEAAMKQYDRFVRLPGCLFENVTGYNGTHNFLHQNVSGMDYAINVSQYVQAKNFKEALHIGSASYEGIINEAVFKSLRTDIMQSVATWLSELLDHYRVLSYTGQLDAMVSYPMTVNFLRRLKFKGANEYSTAIRNIWYVDDDVAGYVKQIGNLTEVLVRNSGHTASTDSPYWTLDLIRNFVQNVNLHEKSSK